MIPYTQSVASQEVPPPYHFPGVTVNALRLGGPPGQGAGLLRPVLQPGRCERARLHLRAGAHVALRHAAVHRLPGDDQRQPDTDEAVLDACPTPTAGSSASGRCSSRSRWSGAGSAGRRLITDTTLEWALPFIVVGEPMSAVCGREMLGLEKLRADIQIGESSFPDSFRGQVSLPGWPT